jgi:hypothetical protein
MDAIIGELLHQHECVIVPGLGGFLTNYSPARIHPVHHVFVPPSKYIVFNAGLSYNDGILANHLSSIKNITFRESLEAIGQWVNDHQLRLKSGNEWTIDNIGTLTIDRENNLQFEPFNKLNYLVESYGLSSFVSPPIKRIDLNIDLLPVKRTYNSRNTMLALKWAAAVIPFAGIALWASVHVRDLNRVYTNYSSFLPWENFADNNLSVKETIKPAKLDFTEFCTVNSSILKDRSGLVSLRQTISDPSEGQSIIPEMIVKNQPDGTDAIISSPYHIIGGAFRIFQNAGNYVDALRKKGYPASIVDKNHYGLYVVSISAYEDKNAALAQLSRIRSVENPEAWLMTR